MESSKELGFGKRAKMIFLRKSRLVIFPRKSRIFKNI